MSDSHQLKRFEYIKGVVLELRPFDIEKDLVTATLKKKRNNLLKHYEVCWKTLFLFSLKFSKTQVNEKLPWL